MSSVAKSIELLAEGDTLEEATEAAVEEASKTIGLCWIEGEAGVHQHSSISIRRNLPVTSLRLCSHSKMATYWARYFL